MQKKTVILGAGLSGLGAARSLPGSMMYEAKEHVGGHVYSHAQGGLHFDEGAHICHAKDETWKASLFANAEQVVTVPQSNIANWWHGQWVSYPVQNHLRDLPPDLRIRALQEIVTAQRAEAKQPPDNYEIWCRGQYGDFLTERFYREYTDKYWRTPMADMDTDWLSGRLLPSQIDRILHGAIAPLDEKQSVFSSFHYPARGGFFAFFEKFYREVEVKTGFKVEGLRLKERKVLFSNGESVLFDKLISTMPLNDLIRAMGDEAPTRIRADAETLRHTQMLGINIVVNKPRLAPYHWFYIYDPSIEISRVKVMSNVIPESMSSGYTVLQTEIFRRDDEVVNAESLKVKAIQEMATMLGFHPERDVISADHVYCSHSYTIPTRGRQAAVDRISDWLEGQGIITAGLYGRWKYVWSDQAYQSGVEAARRVMG